MTSLSYELYRKKDSSDCVRILLDVASATAQPSRLLRVEELANFLGLSPTTLRAWRHNRMGPPSLKVGGQIRYAPEDVAAWLAARKRTPVEPGGSAAGSSRAADVGPASAGPIPSSVDRSALSTPEGALGAPLVSAD